MDNLFFSIGKVPVTVKGQAVINVTDNGVIVTPGNDYSMMVRAIKVYISANDLSVTNKIDWIKAAKRLLDCGLVEAKELVDQIFES